MLCLLNNPPVLKLYADMVMLPLCLRSMQCKPVKPSELLMNGALRRADVQLQIRAGQLNALLGH